MLVIVGTACTSGEDAPLSALTIDVSDSRQAKTTTGRNLEREPKAKRHAV
jgi:hypothetical protein